MSDQDDIRDKTEEPEGETFNQKDSKRSIKKLIEDNPVITILITLGLLFPVIDGITKFVNTIFGIDEKIAYQWFSIITVCGILVPVIILIYRKKGKNIINFIRQYGLILIYITLTVTAIWGSFRLGQSNCPDIENSDCTVFNITLTWNGDYISHEKRKDHLTKGVIQFTELEDSVYGIYINPEGEINKLYAVKGKTDSIISGKWINFEDHKDGTFEFEMHEDGTFTGIYETESGAQNTWNGKREGNVRIIETEIKEILSRKEKRLKKEIVNEEPSTPVKTINPPDNKPKPTSLENTEPLTEEKPKQKVRPKEIVRNNEYYIYLGTIADGKWNQVENIASNFYKKGDMFNEEDVCGEINGSAGNKFVLYTSTNFTEESHLVEYPITLSPANIKITTTLIKDERYRCFQRMRVTN